MRWLTFRQIALAVMLLSLTLTGCKRSVPTQSAKTETVLQAPGAGPAVQSAIPAVDRVVVTNELKQIGLLYRNFLDQNNRPPATADDLLKAGEKLNRQMVDGVYVVFWEVNLDQLQDNKAKTLLAFSKDVPTKGGMALMADCQTVVQMRPDEYKAALKPPGR